MYQFEGFPQWGKFKGTTCFRRKWGKYSVYKFVMGKRTVGYSVYDDTKMSPMDYLGDSDTFGGIRAIVGGQR